MLHQVSVSNPDRIPKRIAISGLVQSTTNRHMIRTDPKENSAMDQEVFAAAEATLLGTIGGETHEVVTGAPIPMVMHVTRPTGRAEDHLLNWSMRRRADYEDRCLANRE